MQPEDASGEAVMTAEPNMLRQLFIAFLASAFLFIVAPVNAAELKLSGIVLEPCSLDDPGNQPDFKRPMGASCYVLSGSVENQGPRTVVDTDMYARILDASGEPVLQNRTRVGSIGDVEPGLQPFALRLSVPAGTPGPFEVRNPRARGFNAPVRTRAGFDDDDVDVDDLLPLERAIQ